MQPGGVTKRNAGQVSCIHFDDRQVGEWIAADELRGQNPAITHGHADIHCSVDHMLIGHDVTIRRDDHTASQTMLDSGLLLRHLELMTELASKGTEELLHISSILIHLL